MKLEPYDWSKVTIKDEPLKQGPRSLTDDLKVITDKQTKKNRREG